LTDCCYQSGWQDVGRKLEVAVVCLYSNRIDEVKSRLLKKHATTDRINLHVKCANALQEKMYDVFILSALSEDHGKFAEDKDITSAFTKARFVLSIVVKVVFAINYYRLKYLLFAFIIPVDISAGRYFRERKSMMEFSNNWLMMLQLRTVY
jgi:hypothetical protein